MLDKLLVEHWQAHLQEDFFLVEEIDHRIKIAIGSASSWILIGGPPCQAYSVIGRARQRQKEGLDENDPASMARWMKRMGKEMGEDLGEDVDSMIDQAMEEEMAGKGEESGSKDEEL